MDLTNVDLNLLVAFEALEAERSVTKAARRIGIGQPAMSDALRRLRRLFDDPLLVRTGRVMRPTPRALHIAPGVGEALRRIRETLGAEVPFDPGVTTETFTIAATDYTAFVLLPAIAARLDRDAPRVDLRVIGYEKSSVGKMLERGEIDLALGVFPDPPQRAVVTKLFAERFVGVACRAHPALSDGEIDLETYVRLPHALVSVSQDAWGAIDDVLLGLGRSRRIALTVPHMLILPRILDGGRMISALPGRLVSALGDSRLTTFRLPLDVPAWSVEMLWMPEARTDRATAWLRGCIKEEAARLDRR